MKKCLKLSSTIIRCVIAMVLANNYVRTAFSQTSKPEFTQQIQNASNEHIQGLYDIHGLRLHLPAKPVRKVINLPLESRNIIKSYEIFEAQSGSTLALVAYIVYIAPEVNLDGAANGSIAEVKALPNVSDFTSEIHNIKVNGLDGRKTTIKYRRGNHRLENQGIILSRGREAWHINISGVTSESQEVTKLAEKVLSSISIAQKQ